MYLAVTAEHNRGTSINGGISWKNNKSPFNSDFQLYMGSDIHHSRVKYDSLFDRKHSCN